MRTPSTPNTHLSVGSGVRTAIAMNPMGISHSVDIVNLEVNADYDLLFRGMGDVARGILHSLRQWRYSVGLEERLHFIEKRYVLR